jgi:hypothetical protein
MMGPNERRYKKKKKRKLLGKEKSSLFVEKKV